MDVNLYRKRTCLTNGNWSWKDPLEGCSVSEESCSQSRTFGGEVCCIGITNPTGSCSSGGCAAGYQEN